MIRRQAAGHRHVPADNHIRTTDTGSILARSAYRRLRRLGLSAHDAHSVTYDLLFAGVFSEFVAAEFAAPDTWTSVELHPRPGDGARSGEIAAPPGDSPARTVLAGPGGSASPEGGSR